MESILRVNIPIQIISCTDTDGKITPLKFRFEDKSGKLITVNIDKILSSDKISMGVNFVCTSMNYNLQREFRLRYSHVDHTWKMTDIQA